MAWSVTDWSANPDWHSAALLNEFVDAVNERGVACGVGPLISVVNVGDDVQSATGVIFQCQQTIEGIYSQFIQSHDAGVKRALTYWNGGTTRPDSAHYASLSALFAAAGLSSTSWRRYREAPASEGGTPEAPGVLTIGDIIGPWLFEDLQKVLNALIWMSLSEDVYEEDGYNSGTGAGATWAAAKAAAEVMWNSGTGAGVGSTAEARSHGSEWAGTYTAMMQRAIQKAHAPDITTAMVRRVAWYIGVAKYDGYVWDANGDAVLEDQLSNWLTEDYAVGVEARTTSSVGTSMTMPVWCAEPGVDSNAGRGYVNGGPIGGVTNVISWDVPGGFQYV